MNTLRTYTIHLLQEIKDYFLVLLLFIIISQCLLTKNDAEF